MRNDNGPEHDDKVNWNAEHGLGHEHDGQVNMNDQHGLRHQHDGQTHVQAMEEMHRQATRRLSFDSWLPRNIGNEGSSSSHIEQMDHIIEPHVASVGLTRDGFSTPKKTPHIPTMVSLCFFLFEFGGGVKNFFVVNLIFFCICSVLHIYLRVGME
jgi:hypothetical protein